MVLGTRGSHYMERRTKLNIDGRLVDAISIPVRSSEERWSEYILEDATVIRMKLIVTEVFRVEGMYDPDGNPVYHIKSANIASAMPPENLKKLPGS